MGLKGLFPRKQDGDAAPDEETWDDGADAIPFAQEPSSVPLPTLTAAHADAVRFHTSKPGYAFSQVEQFVQQVSKTLNRLEEAVYEKDVALHQAREEIARLEEHASDLQATIEVFRAKGDVLTTSDGDYVKESQLAGLEASNAERDALLAQVAELQTALQEAEAAAAVLASEKDALAEQLAEARQAQKLQAATGDPALQIALDETVEERDALLNRVENLGVNITELETALQEAEEKRSQLADELEELRNAAPSSVTATSSNPSALEASLTEAEAARDVAVSAAARAETERDAAIRTKDEAVLEKSALEQQIATLMGERDAAAKAKQAATEAKDAALVRAGKADAERDAAETERARLADEVASLRAELASAQQADNTADIDAVTAARDAAETERARLADEVASLRAELASAQQADNTADIDAVTAARDAAETERARLADEVTVLKAQLSTASAASGDSARVTELEAALAATRAELADVTAAEAELRQYVDTTLAQWQQAAQEAATGASPQATQPADTVEPQAVETPNATWGQDEDDDEWGDAPTASRPDSPTAPPSSASAPEVGGAIPPAPAGTADGGVPQRAHAPLIDAPEVQQRGQ